MDRAKEKERKNRREHSWLCPERRTKRKTTEDTGAGVALSPRSADGRLKLASTRHSLRLAPCPLRASAAASPRHQRLAAVCLPASPLPVLLSGSPSHRLRLLRPRSHGMPPQLDPHSRSAHDSPARPALVHILVHITAHVPGLMDPGHVPGPIRSITHVALAVVARVARQRRSTTRCHRSLSTVPGPALPRFLAHDSTRHAHRSPSTLPRSRSVRRSVAAVTRVSLTDGDRCPQCGQRSTGYRQHYRAAIDCPPAISDHMLCPTIACSSPVYTVYSTCSVTWSHQRAQPSRLTALSPLQPASAGCDGSCLTRVDAVYPHTARALASTPARTASRCAVGPTGARRLRSRGCLRDCTARTGLQ